ncbi:MAG: DNA adenine methylase [Treponema sp.]|nr:DNA adenine methylase [Treponema sp.]
MAEENPSYLQDQLITYIGNKRALLPFIGQGVSYVQNRLKLEKLDCLDLFSGSGVVARYLKQFSSSITVNDLELYSYIINTCYLSNLNQEEKNTLEGLYNKLNEKIDIEMQKLEEKASSGEYEAPGFITRLYSPGDINNIKKTDRCFYTPYNANYIDIARQLIDSQIPKEYQSFFIAPLLSEASIHANTAGIFKGFYKNSRTKTGQFGGNGKNALSRITGKIKLKMPLLSNYECTYKVFSSDANKLALEDDLYSLTRDGTFDLVYLDPPYNQHPYGSNYFMLNLIASYKEPDEDLISRVSGIPHNWNRSDYNKKKKVADAFYKLVDSIRAKYILISFNSEGFLTKDEMIEMFSNCGKVEVLESNYNTFRGSRNLSARDIHVKEYLFVVEKKF